MKHFVLIIFLVCFCSTFGQIPCNIWQNKPITQSDTLALIEYKINKVSITEILSIDSLNIKEAGCFFVSLKDNLLTIETRFLVDCSKITNQTIKKDTIVQTINLPRIKGDDNEYYCTLTHLIDTNGVVYKTICKYYPDKLFIYNSAEIIYYYENKLLIKAEYYYVFETNGEQNYLYEKLLYNYSH